MPRPDFPLLRWIALALLGLVWDIAVPIARAVDTSPIPIVAPFGYARTAATLGTSEASTLYIRNKDFTPLMSGLIVTVTGPNAGDFVAGTIPDSVNPWDYRSTFDLPIRFTPTAVGVRTATLSISSSTKPDRAPFTLALSAFGSPVELRYSGPSGALVSRTKDTVDLGDMEVGTSKDVAFVLRNIGDTALGSLGIGISFSLADRYAVVKLPRSNLPAGQSSDFAIRLKALAPGDFSGYITLNHFVSGEVPFYMTIKGKGVTAKLGLLDVRKLPVSTTGENMVFVIRSYNFAKFEGTLTPLFTNVVALAQGGHNTLALRADGTLLTMVTPYDQNQKEFFYFDTGITNAVSIGARYYDTWAILNDGTVAQVGPDTHLNIPPHMKGIESISVGSGHTLILKRDGTVLATGDNSFGQAKVPANLTGVKAVATGMTHSVALKKDGTVVSWGGSDFGPMGTPKIVSGITAIAAADDDAFALRADGRLATWSGLYGGYFLNDVATITSDWHPVALTKDGSAIPFSESFDTRNILPAQLGDVTAITVNSPYMSVIAQIGNTFSPLPPGVSRTHTLYIDSQGDFQLNNISAAIEGPDADQFSISTAVPASLPIGKNASFKVRFAPTRIGSLTANLKVYSNDPASPFVLPLQGTGVLETIAMPSTLAGSTFTYSALASDRLTGRMLQNISYTNTAAFTLSGLRLILSHMGAGVQVYSSSAGSKPGEVEALYTQPIKHGETVSFTLTYFDPQRRSAAAVTPVIKAEALDAAEPQPGLVAGTPINLLGVRDTPSGPLLEWNTVRNGVYVVEYSDDHGASWHAAVHRLGTGGTRMLWIDRGQPETQTKPVNKAARLYRVKRV